MTLKAVKQFTNTAWIIGGVAAATGGYSYFRSVRAPAPPKYTSKVLGTISTIEDIEDYENQKGCLFLFFTEKNREGIPQPEPNPPISLRPNYNEFYQGGVLSARRYLEENKDKQDALIKVANEAKNKCVKDKLLYEAIGN